MRSSATQRKSAPSSVDGEAVQQARAAGADEAGLAAAARGVRRIPGLQVLGLGRAPAVGMPEHRGTLVALGPVSAGMVGGVGEGGSVPLRAGEYVVLVRLVAVTVDDGALLGDRGLLGDAVGPMQVAHVLGDDRALGVLPRAAPDPVAGVDRAGALRAEIGVPCVV